MTRIRLQAVLVATDSSHAVLVGMTDGGTVRVRARCSTELGLVLAVAAEAAGPIDIEVPDEAIDSQEEIDPGSPAG